MIPYVWIFAVIAGLFVAGSGGVYWMLWLDDRDAKRHLDRLMGKR